MHFLWCVYIDLWFMSGCFVIVFRLIGENEELRKMQFVHYNTYGLSFYK